MVIKKIKKIQLQNSVKKHIEANLKEYIIVSLMFVIGVFLGIMFINGSNDSQKNEITSYIENYVSMAKDSGKINFAELLKNSIKENVILAIELWFAGTTIIGIPIVFGIILYRGFCLGYTISACVYTMGISKGMAFILISVLLQNIIFIPALFALCVSGIKLYKSIVKDRRKENIKIEVFRHTAFSIFMMIFFVVSAFIKTNISGGLIQNLIKYF